MNARVLCAALAAVALLAAGCGSSPDEVTGPGGSTTHTETESNDFTAQSLGTLGTTEISVSGTASSDADVDLYRFTVAANANLHVSLGWNGGQDLDVAISNTSGIMVQHQDTSANPEVCYLDGLGAGDYTVRVGSRSGSAAAYVLRIGRH